MSVFSSTREIAAPTGVVFAFLADGRRHSEWVAGDDGGRFRKTVDTEHVSGPEVGEGATYRLRQRMGRKTMADYTFRTDLYEPDRRLVFRADGGAFDVLFDLEAADGGTRLTCTREHEGRRRGLTDWLLQRFALKPQFAEPVIQGDLMRIERALGVAGDR